MDSFFCSLSPKILVNQMSIWPKGNEMLKLALGRIPLCLLETVSFFRTCVGRHGSWLCVSEQKRMGHICLLVNSELQTRDLFWHLG